MSWLVNLPAGFPHPGPDRLKPVPGTPILQPVLRQTGERPLYRHGF
jgi:hypothetical protein